MKKKYLKTSLSITILIAALAVFIYSVGAVVEALETRLIDMTLTHALLLVIFARVLFWDRKWKW